MDVWAGFLILGSQSTWHLSVIVSVCLLASMSVGARGWVRLSVVACLSLFVSLSLSSYLCVQVCLSRSPISHSLCECVCGGGGLGSTDAAAVPHHGGGPRLGFVPRRHAVHVAADCGDKPKGRPLSQCTRAPQPHGDVRTDTRSLTHSQTNTYSNTHTYTHIHTRKHTYIHTNIHTFHLYRSVLRVTCVPCLRLCMPAWPSRACTLTPVPLSLPAPRCVSVCAFLGRRTSACSSLARRR
jgi:hypothetical protein